MTIVKQLDWSKLKPKQTRPVFKIKKRKQRWASAAQARVYVDLIFVSKVQEMIDNDKDI